MNEQHAIRSADLSEYVGPEYLQGNTTELEAAMRQIATADEATFRAVEAQFKESNEATKAFYHDHIFRNLHRPMSTEHGIQGVSAIMELRRQNALNDVEFSVREELGISYPFPPYKLRSENGQLRLYAEGLGYLDQVFNPDGPRSQEWPEARRHPESINYKRAKLEYETLAAFQASEALQQAKPGDSFIWTSPSVYDIHLDSRLSVEQKKALLEQVCYGFQTYIFSYTMQENGDLQGRVHTTYFNPNGLKALYKDIYGEEKLTEFPEDAQLDTHLLGKIESLPCTSDQLQQAIVALETDKTNLFDLPEDIKVGSIEAHEVEEVLDKCRPLALHYYHLLLETLPEELMNSDFQHLINKNFQTWRNAAYSLLGGAQIDDLEYFANLRDDDICALAQAQIDEIRAYRSGDFSYYEPGMGMHAARLDALASSLPEAQVVATGCGFGAGFNGGEGTASVMGIATTYEGIQYGQSSSGRETVSRKKRTVEIGCPNCSEKAGKRVVVKAIIQNSSITCTTCKSRAPYKC